MMCSGLTSAFKGLGRLVITAWASIAVSKKALADIAVAVGPSETKTSNFYVINGNGFFPWQHRELSKANEKIPGGA